MYSVNTGGQDGGHSSEEEEANTETQIRSVLPRRSCHGRAN
jgi:hypothetical protein